MQIGENVQYLSIYFVMGDAPAGWTRNAIKDPPSGGWSNAFVITKEGFLPKIFVPYSLQSWPVPKECYELERTREPIKELDKPWMLDCLKRSFATYSKIGGHAIDTQAAHDVIVAMGFEEMPEEFAQVEEERKVTKKERVKAERTSKPNAREGLTTVAQIAEELKIIPRIARGYLRAAKIEKPEIGWAGDQAWADSIREALKAEMNKEKPVKAPPPIKAKAVKPKPEPVSKVSAKKATPKASKKAAAPLPKAKKTAAATKKANIKVIPLGKPGKGKTFAGTPEGMKAAAKHFNKTKSTATKKKGKAR